MMLPSTMSAMSASEISPSRELLGDDRAGGARRLADAQRQMPGRPAHRHAEVPAAGRPRVLHQALDDADADVARRLVAERRERQRQPQVVVDALRHLHDLDDAAALDGDGAAHHVVAADADERVDLELGERGDACSRGSRGRASTSRREEPRSTPPSRWMRETSSIVSSCCSSV